MASSISIILALSLESDDQGASRTVFAYPEGTRHVVREFSNMTFSHADFGGVFRIRSCNFKIPFVHTLSPNEIKVVLEPSGCRVGYGLVFRPLETDKFARGFQIAENLLSSGSVREEEEHRSVRQPGTLMEIQICILRRIVRYENQIRSGGWVSYDFSLGF